MKGFCTLFLMLGFGLLFSCKTKTTYDKNAYAEIMNQSIRLHAIQQKGQNNPGKFVAFSDTLYTNDKLPKEVIDSINTARKKEYKR